MRRIALCVLLLAPAVARAEPEGLAGVLEQSSPASPEEQQAFAAAALAEIQGAVKTVEKLLADQEDQKEKNTEAIECLQRKLTPLKEIQGFSEGSGGALTAALGERDMVHADLAYRQIAVALSKARDFLAEAKACVGDAGARSGDQAVSVDDGGAGAEPPLSDTFTVDVPVASPI